MVRPLLRRVVYSLVLQSIEAYLAVLAILVGLPVLLEPRFTPGTVNSLFPTWMIIVWAGGLVVGGIVTLAAILSTNYRIERMGVSILWATTLTYALALSRALPNSLLPFMTYGMFALSMMARYWVLGRLLRMNSNLARLRKQVAALEKEIGES